MTRYKVMATRMDEATRRARRWLQANSFHCACEDCANAIVRLVRQTEARVRREDIAYLQTVGCGSGAAALARRNRRPPRRRTTAARRR